MNKLFKSLKILHSLDSPAVRKAHSCFNQLEERLPEEHKKHTIALYVIDSPGYWAGMVEGEKSAGSHKLYVTEGFVKMLTSEQLVAVMAHEWAHISRKINLIKWIAPFAAAFASLGINMLFLLLVWQPQDVIALLAFFFMGTMLGTFAILQIEKKIGKHQEYVCDRFAASMVSPSIMVGTLRRVNQLMGGNMPHSKTAFQSFWSSYQSTHPSASQRVRHIHRNRHQLKKGVF